jgi:hypothetical protein
VGVDKKVEKKIVSIHLFFRLAQSEKNSGKNVIKSIDESSN